MNCEWAKLSPFVNPSQTSNAIELRLGRIPCQKSKAARTGPGLKTDVFETIYNRIWVSEMRIAWLMKGIHRCKFVFSSVLGLVLALSGCAPAHEKTLVVGMELNYPPFEMVDPQGRPFGLSVDLAQALGRYLHRKVQIENIPFDGLIPALKTGKIDLIISCIEP